MLWEQLLIIAVLILLGVVTYSARMMSVQYKTPFREELVGICTSVVDQTFRRQKNLEKIIDILRDKEEVQNYDIRKELKVSSRTVVRYMDELEEDGLIEQVGEVGHAVVYQLKK